MSLYQDRQIKGFLLFLTLFALLFVGTATVLTIYQVNDAEVLWLKHDEAVSSSLLEQGVPKEVVAVAFTNTDISDDGRSLLAAAGLGKQSESSMRPYFNQFQRSAFCTMLCTVLFFLFVLAIGIFIFFWKRKRLYQQADKILLNYINGDYSCHLPQNYEGAIYQVFSSIEQLATMLQSKNETERKAKEFLKDTISDISHQLKTPLAALTMYQEIIESEPENAETVKQFAAKMGISLKRMEQLILSMLKITRLDTGNIIFEKKSCRVSELIAHSVNDLTTRAKSESKQIQIDGDGEQQLICDMEWTGEAIGNIVKNALDHTQAGGIVRITWERTPAMFRIFISDNGNGIVPTVGQRGRRPAEQRVERPAACSGNDSHLPDGKRKGSAGSLFQRERGAPPCVGCCVRDFLYRRARKDPFRAEDRSQPAYTGISGASAGTGLPEKEGRKTRQCSSRHGRPRRVGKGPDAAGTSEPGQSVPRNVAPVCGPVEAEPAFLWPGILRKKPDCHVPRRRHLGPDRKLPAGISARRRKAVAALQLCSLFH